MDKYKFSLGEKIYIVFDLNGYVLEAKGFGMLMWSNLNSLELEKDLIGKHIDEIAQMLKENGARQKYYNDFEINVHIPLLKIMLEEKKNNN